MKKTTLQLIITLLLLGCGGGSGNSNTATPEISHEKVILKQEILFIVNHTEKENCESHEFYNLIAEYNPNIKNILIKSIDENDKECADYSRDETNCEKFNMEEESKFCCLIGSDQVTSTEDATQWFDKWYNKDWYFNQWETEEEIAQLENTASAEETVEEVYSYPSTYDNSVQYNQDLYNQQLQNNITDNIIYGGYDDYNSYSYEDYSSYGDYGYDGY